MDKFVYVLLSDGDGTMHSIPTLFGVAVDSEDEAKRFVEEATKAGWWEPGYVRVRIFDNKDEAIKWAFKK